MEKQELNCSKRRSIFEQEKRTLCELLNTIELCIKLNDSNMFDLYILILKAIVQALRIKGCIDESADNTVYYYTFKIVSNYAAGSKLDACYRLDQLKRFIQSDDFGYDDGC